MKQSLDLFVGLAILAALASGCSKTTASSPPMPTPTVTVSQPIAREIVDYNEFRGNTEAVESVEIRARVSGYLTKINFAEGHEVKKGDVLFEIDPRPYQADLDRAVAQIASNEARLKRATADATRANTLRPNGAISAEEFDKIMAEKADAEASLAGGRAALESARLDFEFTKVTAPISGRVGRAMLTVGNLVIPGTRDTSLLTTLVSVDPIYVYFDVDEPSMLQYQKLIRESKLKSAEDTEIPVEMGLANEQGFPHKGIINFVDNRVDRSTATLKLRAVFDNSFVSNNVRMFTPGLNVRVRLAASPRYSALLVSDRAIGVDQGTKFVYVVDAQNKVQRREVQTGKLNNGLRVIQSGIAVDDRVVVNGLQRIREGVTVVAEEKPMPDVQATPAVVVEPASK